MTEYFTLKSLKSVTEFKKKADEEIKKKSFSSACELLTKALIYAPTYIKIKDQVTIYPLSQIYLLRSYVFYEMKLFKKCINDIKLAQKNGIKYSDKVQLTEALCFWHLNLLNECRKIVGKWLLLNKTDVLNVFSKKFYDLRDKLEARTFDLSNYLELNSNQKSDEVCSFEGLNNKLNIVENNIKGRHIVAKQNIHSNAIVVCDEAFVAMIEDEFVHSLCDYCFKYCKQDGIPCYGCDKSLYCSTTCRQNAWRKHHWFECCFEIKSSKMMRTSLICLRILLNAANNLNNKTSNNHLTTHIYSSISNYLVNQYLAQDTKSSEVKGTNPSNGKYLGDYWSIFCLQTHLDNHHSKVISECTLNAKYLAQCITNLWKYLGVFNVEKDLIIPTNDPYKTCEELLMKIFKFLQIDECVLFASDHQSDISSFRKSTKQFCKRFVYSEADNDEPLVKTKPNSLENLLSKLLFHHMLQLRTNSQAIFQVIDSSYSNDLYTTNQSRIATALYPSLSLLNHSCKPNTSLNFVGRKAIMKSTDELRRGDELMHCYGPCIQRHCFKDRQQMLETQYLFTCQCESCRRFNSDQTQTSDLDDSDAFACQSCRGPLRLLQNSSAICLSCDKHVQLDKTIAAYHKILEEVQQPISDLEEDRLKEIFMKVKSSKTRLKQILFHKHLMIASVNDKLAFLASEMKNWELSITYLMESIPIIVSRFGESSLEVGREFHKLASLQIRCSFPHQPIISSLLRARKIFKLHLLPSNVELLEVESLLNQFRRFD